MKTNEHIAHVAATVVTAAAKLTAAAFRQQKDVREKGPGNLVTKMDLEVDRQIKAAVAAEFPDHGFISEESGESNADAEHVWILDPIDGTSYFVDGIPLYSVSLALRKGHELVLGVVFNPETNELFCAEAGQGASLNGASVRCSEKKRLSEAVVCVEIPHRHFPTERIDFATKCLDKLIREAGRVRIIGVSALGLCYTTTGFDAYVNLSTGSKIWDTAAGEVILREAGGHITKTVDNEIIGGPPVLHDELLDLLGLRSA